MHWTGLRILNTRPLGQNKDLSQKIHAIGAVSIECPALAIEPVEEDWLTPLGNLSTFQQAIFISTNTVEHCFNRLNALYVNWPASIRLAAIGAATKRALEQRGLRVDDLPLRECSEGLLELDVMQQVEGRKILLLKGEKGRGLLADSLKKRGALLYSTSVYRRVLPTINPAFIRALWQEDKVDVIMITSEEAMRNIFCLFGDEAHAWLRSKPFLVISERLAQTAAEWGMKTIVTHILL